MFDFGDIDTTCIRCGICRKQQAREAMPEIEIGQLAKTLAAARSLEDIPNQSTEFITSCSLCDACTARCPRNISCAAVTRAARQLLGSLQPCLSAAYRAFRVDYQENLFSALRQAAGVAYPEALIPLPKTAPQPHTTERDIPSKPDPTDNLPAPAQQASLSLFLPGCALDSFAPPLTLATLELLLERGVVDGMTAYCCGNPLKNAGLISEYNQYAGHLLALLGANQVTKLIVACPNCLHSLSHLLKQATARETELVPLPEVLLELGQYYVDKAVTSPGPAALSSKPPLQQRTRTLALCRNKPPVQQQVYPSATLCDKLPSEQHIRTSSTRLRSVAVHDSCPDRFDQRFGWATRRLFTEGGLEVLELQSHGRNSICCGAGGLAQVLGQDHALQRRERRLAEFAQTNADCLICSCASCVNAFLAKSPAPAVRHYLELILGVPINWQALEAGYNQALAQLAVWDEFPDAHTTPVFTPTHVPSQSGDTHVPRQSANAHAPRDR
ncbi:MAG: (Fe-S)-binding protein [Coriobacteriales bacterium]|jgi:Fe-S oxidoreductase|nr:(Fe-S)-binding protein [Coriobacteriales bacterium]